MKNLCKACNKYRRLVLMDYLYCGLCKQAYLVRVQRNKTKQHQKQPTRSR